MTISRSLRGVFPRMPPASGEIMPIIHSPWIGAFVGRFDARALLLLAWAGTTFALILLHEPWRDEVRALSFAREGATIFDMLKTVGQDGHPFVWFALLRVAFDVFQSTLVLPITAFSVAAAAVGLFVYRAPFSLLFKAAFIFSGFMMHEYVVVARNYGISVLFLFCATVVYTAAKRRPALLGVVLFLLANCNVHSALLAMAFLLVPFWDAVAEWRDKGTTEKLWGFVVTAALAGAGFVLCVLSIYPPQYDAIKLNADKNFTYSLVTALFLPGLWFPAVTFDPVFSSDQLLTLGQGGISTLLIFAAIVGLAPNWKLALTGAMAFWGLAGLFAFVYAGNFRHQALLTVLLVALYWIRNVQAGDSTQTHGLRSSGFGVGLSCAMPILLGLQVVNAAVTARREVLRPFSMGQSVAMLIKSDTKLRNATVMADPDYFLEPLPYYVGNPLYLIREGRYGSTVKFVSSARLDISLADILAVARQLRQKSGSPTIILLAMDLTSNRPTAASGYGWITRAGQNETSEFLAAVEKIASRQMTLTDESYDVYVLW